MAISIRNKRFLNRFNEEAAIIVADAIKERRKLKKFTLKPKLIKKPFLLINKPDKIE